jgi:sugar fermentation stimulation protein A
MLHTHRTNGVARYLIEAGVLPGFEDARILRAEVPIGRSRFDFLLRDKAGECYLEVKSCTLVGKEVAMFPDAVTERGARHLEELARLSREGKRTAVLFVVHWPFARLFMPDYHTDLHFARTFLKVREYVDIMPVAVRWRNDMSLGSDVKTLEIPWDYITQESKDRGSYLLVLRLSTDRRIGVGSLGQILFRKGFYVYVGSAMANLTERIERHRRLRKRHHWHIDALRDVADFSCALAIRSSVPLECKLAGAVSRIAEWSIPKFGSSDCGCRTHLFGFGDNPVGMADFQKLLLDFRMGDRYKA